MPHSNRARLGKRIATTAFAAGAAVAVSSVLSLSSAQAAPSAGQADRPERTLVGDAPESSMSISSSGGRAGDLTLDGRQDITGRQPSTGNLYVYPHSGAFNGTATYTSPTRLGNGWNVMTWLGVGEANGDGISDVIGRLPNGTLLAYLHSGTVQAQYTLQPGIVLGSGWQGFDLITTVDYDGDGFDDIVARHAATKDYYIYYHSGVVNGTATYLPGQVFITGGTYDDFSVFTDVTGDGLPDQLFRDVWGYLGVFDLYNDAIYDLGVGWEAFISISISDANLDGSQDIIGRTGDGTLFAYQYAGWNPASPTTTYRSPVILGFGWNTLDIIT